MATKKTTNSFEKKKVKELNDEITKYWDEFGVDNDEGIDVPLHLRGGQWTWNFEKKMPLVDKITLVITIVNVAILISLVVAHW